MMINKSLIIDLDLPQVPKTNAMPKDLLPLIPDHILRGRALAQLKLAGTGGVVEDETQPLSGARTKQHRGLRTRQYKEAKGTVQEARSKRDPLHHQVNQ